MVPVERAHVRANFVPRVERATAAPHNPRRDHDREHPGTLNP